MLGGVIYAMAGGTVEHSRLASNMNTALKTAHAEREVFQSDAMLFVRVTQLSTLSDSTEDYDRGEKFAHYMRIPSLEEYVLVSQRSPKIEVFRRPERGHWSHETARAGESIEILGRAIVVDDIYARVSPALA